jgi:hypothetical protein
MSPPSPQEPAVTLETFEHEVRHLAEGAALDSVRWNGLLARLQEALPDIPPPLDPDEARRSCAELLQLLQALRHPPTPVAPPTTSALPQGSLAARSGYVLEGERGSQEARVRPALAEALASGKPLESWWIDDLWAVDFALWRQLSSGQSDTRTLALAWLKSPGRRLIQDLAALGRLPSPEPLGATGASLGDLEAAAGPLPTAAVDADLQHTHWYELHAAIPGLPLARWQPASRQQDSGSVQQALQILEGRRGEPVFLRGAALGWLLNQAARDPFYELDGISPSDPRREVLKRDLREDLLPALVSGFPAPEDESRHAQLRTALRLEAVCLQHAARLTAGDSSPEAVARAWSLARWLQSCTFRSPFFGGDEEALIVRLRALLPKDLAGPPRDVLDPLRFTENQGLDLAELAVVSAVAWHYSAKDTPKLKLTPLPVVHVLRRIARRQLRDADREAEEYLARHRAVQSPSEQAGPSTGNALGWQAPHISPPLLARRLMTELRIGWLQYMPNEVMQECLDLFEQQPLRHPWVAFALYTEGARLPQPVRERAAGAWREVLKRMQPKEPEHRDLFFNAGPTHMAAGVLDQLTEAEVLQAVQLAQAALPEWRHRALEGLAEAAEKLKRDEAWHRAVDGLMDMLGQERLLEDPKRNDEERMKAALLALRRISARPLTHPDRPVYLQRLAAVASRPPFNQNYNLRLELRRLGVSSAT